MGHRESRPPADVEVPPDADVIVKPNPGSGQRLRFHKPKSESVDEPSCSSASQYPDVWTRKKRRQLGDMRGPCKECYDPAEAFNPEKPCPLCGEKVTSVAYHLRHACEVNQ